MDESTTNQPENPTTESLENTKTEVPVSVADEEDKNSENERISAKRQEEYQKEAAIRLACSTRNLDELVFFATSEGGFLNDEVRRLACRWLIY